MAARLQLPVPGEVGMPIGKIRGALRGMWMEAIPRAYGVNRDQGCSGEPLSGKGFEGGPGPVGKAKKEVEKGEKARPAGETENVPESGIAARPKTSCGKGEKKGGSECYLHGPFLGDMLPGQTLRINRGLGGVTGMAAMIPEESHDEDADLSDDVYAFIRRRPQPWTPVCMMQVASLEFCNVDRDILRATITAVLIGIKKWPSTF